MIGLLGIVTLSGCMKTAPALSAGTELPTIQAEGWLNGSGVTHADLQGKVVVIECFAYW
jgi:hypothetical protein